MKVWIVEHYFTGIHDKGFEIAGVFSSLEKAKNYMNKRGKIVDRCHPENVYKVRRFVKGSFNEILTKHTYQTLLDGIEVDEEKVVL